MYERMGNYKTYPRQESKKNITNVGGVETQWTDTAENKKKTIYSEW